MAPKIIFLVNPEFGQLNVHLSTAYALLQVAPDVEVHLASHRNIEKEVISTSTLALKNCPPGRAPIFFHHVGPSYQECIESKNHSGEQTLLTKPGFFEMWGRANFMVEYACPWNTEQYMETYEATVRVLDEVKPDLAAVDAIFCPGMTAVRARKVKFHLLMPNSLKEAYYNLDAMWTYPGMALGYSYPLAWHLIPANILYQLRLGYSAFTNPGFTALRKSFQAKYGLRPVTLAPMDLGMDPEPGLKYIVAAAPELDFPFPKLGDNVITCGPIMKPFAPLKKSDPALLSWLARGPTIFINFGSHRAVYEDLAVELATAVRLVLASAADAAVRLGKPELARLQVLWKLKQTGGNWFRHYKKYPVKEPGSRIHGILGAEMDADRVRVLDWVDAEPISVVDSGHITCFVHHAGATSALEGLYAGVRHVALPGWADCYDWATRLEYLGVGVWASRKACPNWTAEELGEAMKKVILGAEAGAFQRKADELSEAVKKSESGRVVAAKTLLSELDLAVGR